MKLSVIAPILNEETFLPFYLESVTSFADEILIVDGGSTDRSLELISGYQKKSNIRLFKILQSGMPYSDDWNESKVRNFLVDQATGDWIIALDADEILDDCFMKVYRELMSQPDIIAYGFPLICFWRDPWTVRINAPGDERWSTNVHRMWKKNTGIRFNELKHHCYLQLGNKPVWELTNYQVAEIPLYHYHYALGRRIKRNDNRLEDVNLLARTGEPDWNFIPPNYNICTRPFKGTHPAVLNKYLVNKAVTSDHDLLNNQKHLYYSPV